MTQSAAIRSIFPITPENIRLPLAVQVLPHGEGIPLPFYATSGSAGADLSAAVVETITLAPGARQLIPCGFALALPEGYEAQIRPRSGLAFKNGITVLNAPGTIDADYRGEIQVLLINHSDTAFMIERGMRIAQIIIAPVTQATFEMVDVLPSSTRNTGGFGSTGV
jgi:dUTP pyrophosphatase